MNCNGNAPLFIAVMANDRDVVSELVKSEADVSLFEIKSSNHDEVVDALMALAPAPTADSENEDVDGDVVDAKLIRAFDRMIRNKGLASPVEKNRTAEYAAFRDGLKWIAAEDCEAIVDEFLSLMNEVKEDGDAKQFVQENETRIAELSERYTASEENPGELLKEYLKEQKKLKKLEKPA